MAIRTIPMPVVIPAFKVSVVMRSSGRTESLESPDTRLVMTGIRSMTMVAETIVAPQFAAMPSWHQARIVTTAMRSTKMAV